MESTDKKSLAEERVWIALQESERQRKESELQRKENERFLTEKLAETDRILTEKLAETDRLLKNSIAASDKRKIENDKLFREIRKEIGGIANSNGDFAEEYFENIFYKDMTFAGMHFHEIIKRKRLDDRKRNDEFDIIMLNEENVVIVETKYKAHETDIDTVIGKAESFRYWYPEYKSHKIFLCLASLRFEENIINKARKKGIGIVQQLGDKTEVNDKNLIAY